MKKIMYVQILSLLLVCLLVLGCSVNVMAIDKDRIGLDSPDESGNIAFSVENMFPGDVETKDFTVKVKHKKATSLYYHADIHPDCKDLAEVLMVKIELPEKDVELYDGLMKDMPSALKYDLAADEKEVLYRITAYLDTSVGNEYQNKTLLADFRWWYLTEEIASDDEQNDGSSNDDDDNNYVNVKIIAEKYLNGSKAKGNAYNFELREEDGDLVRSKRNKDEQIEFRSLHLTSRGEYIYTLREEKGDNANVLYDNSEYKVIIKVSRDNDGDLYAKIRYEKDGEEYEGTPRFYNKTVKAPVDTSDNSPLELYLVGFLIAVAALIFLLVLKKRKKEDDAHE